MHIHRSLLLIALLLAGVPAHAVVDDGAATLLNELVTAALAREPRYDVVASADVRPQAIDLRAEWVTARAGADAAVRAAELAPAKAQRAALAAEKAWNHG